MSDQILAEDLRRSFFAHSKLLDFISNAGPIRLFLTGGTGFFGCWLLEGFAWLYQELNLDLSLTVLTRNPVAFRIKSPRLADLPFVKLYPGDVRNFVFPEDSFTHILHAATDASFQLNTQDPFLMFDTITQGTRHVLELGVQKGVRRFLLVSSGAVYGRQPSQLTHVSEEYMGGPDPLSFSSAYSEGKRVAEFLSVLYSKPTQMETTIARCFAFVGPFLSLNSHFAVGNFIGDALAGGPIRVGGDGTPYRSYLYGSDLVVWLLGVLIWGQQGRAYNVGSDEDLPILKLAQTVAQVGSQSGFPLQVSVAQAALKNHPPERYVPSIARASEELGLKKVFSLEESVERTIQWHRFS